MRGGLPKQVDVFADPVASQRLINEAEDIMRTRFSEEKVVEWSHLFPKYLIKRELDE